jgi:methanogenic corrinoid protein MtbC1
MAIVNLERDEAIETVRLRAQKGEDPIQILDECRQGMTIVGEQFQKGDYYLAELMLAAEIFKGATAILEPYMAGVRSSESLGKMVLATPKGDIHDLGKNIFSILLRAHGFEVHDLGVDVDPSLIVAKATEVKPDFIGLSVLITPTFASMRQTADMLEEAGLRSQSKLMIGGGVTTPAVRDYVGADFQTLDATEGVDYCIKVKKGR